MTTVRKAEMSHRKHGSTSVIKARSGVFVTIVAAAVGTWLGVAAPAQASAYGDTVICENNGGWQPGTGSQEPGLQFAQSAWPVCQMYLVDVPPEPTPAGASQLNVPSGVIPGIDFGIVLQTFQFGPGL